MRDSVIKVCICLTSEGPRREGNGASAFGGYGMLGS